MPSRLYTLTFVIAIVVAAMACAVTTRTAVGGRNLTATKAARSTLVAKTRRVNWTDVQTLNTGGRVVYHTTKITTAGDTYTIALSVTNRSDRAVDLMTFPPKKPIGYVSPESFGVAYRDTTTRRLVNTRATTFNPALPHSLQPGDSWQGTFSGRTRELRKHHDWWIFFGMVVPGGHWVSDKTFST